MSRHANFGWSRRRTRSSGSEQDPNSQIKEHWLRVGQNVELFRINGKFTDVEVVVEDESFKAHKVILAGASAYFEAMFTSGLAMKEGHTTIEIREMSARVFKSLLQYLYKGEIEIKEDNVEELLAGANFLNMNEVVNNCCAFLRKKQHPSNVVGFFRFAELYSCTTFKLEAKRYIERHFPEVINEDEFYDLPKELLKTFLRSEGLSIYNEFQVFEATMKWLARDPKERKNHVFELLDCIRLPLVSPKQIDALICETQDEALKSAVQKYIEEHGQELKKLQLERQCLLSEAGSSALNEFQNSYHDVRFQPRMCCRKSVYVVGGNNQTGNFFNDSRTLFTVEKLDTFKWQWKSLPPLSHPRSCLGVADLNSTIYAIGGENDSMILDSVEAFDPLDNEWFTVCSLRMPRSCLGVCALDGGLYAFGGWIGLDVDNGIERYDPVRNKWELYDKLPQKTFAMGIIAFEGLIYIIGGFDERSSPLDTVYSYNPVTKQLTALAKMRRKRGYFGIALLHNFIYAVGGTSGPGSSLNAVERFSILENCWTEIAPLAVARIAPCVAAVNDQLLVIGGKMAGNEWQMPYTLDTVEIYEPEKNRWRDGIPMPTSRCEAAATVL